MTGKGIRTGRTGERFPEDGLSTSAIVTSEISTLEHELGVCRSKVGQRWVGRAMPGGAITHIRNYPVERGPLVAKAMLTGGKLAEVLGSLWDSIVIKFEDDPPDRL